MVPGFDSPFGRIYPYHLLLVFALIAGAFFFTRQIVQKGIPLWRTVCTIPLIVLLTVAFARVFDLFFYNYKHVVENPLSILDVLSGGLSSHGVVIGLFFLVFLLSALFKLKMSLIASSLTLWALIGIFAVRTGDFIHADGTGTVTDLPWAIERGTNLVHPVNIYEAIFAVFLIFMYFILRCFEAEKKKFQKYPFGQISIVIGCYFLSRLYFDSIRVIDKFELLEFEIVKAQIVNIIFIILSVLLFFTKDFYFSLSKFSRLFEKLQNIVPVYMHVFLLVVVTFAFVFMIARFLQTSFFSVMETSCTLSGLLISSVITTFFMLVLVKPGIWLLKFIKRFTFKGTKKVILVFVYLLFFIAACLTMLIVPQRGAVTLFAVFSLILPFFNDARSLALYCLGFVATGPTYLLAESYCCKFILFPPYFIVAVQFFAIFQVLVNFYVYYHVKNK